MLLNLPKSILLAVLISLPSLAWGETIPTRETTGPALTSLQLLDDAIHAANAALNKAALIACQFDDVSPGTVTENNVSPVRCSNLRELFGIIRDAAGNARGANVNASNELLVALSSVPTHAVTQSGTWTMQPGNTANTTPWLATISQGGNVATVNASGQLSMTCANCSGSGASAVDDAAFTPATDSGAPIMGMADEVTPDSVNEGDVGVVRMSLNRNLYSSIRDAAGNERGANVNASNELTTSANTELPAAAALADATANPTVPGVGAYLMCWNATSWDRCQGASNVAHDAAASAANPTLIGGYANAAAPADVSADLDAVRAWFLRNGAQAIQNTFAGILASTGAGAVNTGTQRVIEANDSQLSAGVGATGDAAATAGSTGSITAKLRLMTSQLDTMSTALASLLTSSQLIDDDQTGASLNYHTSVGTTEDETEIKATAGRLLGIHITNTNAAVRYFRCANLTAANTTPGTSTVFYGIAVPGATTGGGFIAPIPASGIAFSTALTCWVVTGAADSDVAEVAANEIKWNVIYK